MSFKKTTSLITCGIFAFSTVAWSAPEVPSAFEIKNIPLVERIQIPESLGRIEEKYAPTQTLEQIDFPTIVHIQDAHASYDGQKKIKELLEYLTGEHGFNLVLLEGGAGELDPKVMRFFTDNSLNFKIADRLAKEAEVGGAELFLIDSTSPSIKAFGVEEEELYWRNLLNFRQVVEKKEVSETFLLQAKAALSSLGSHYFNPALHKFLKEWMLYQDSQAELLRHLNALDKAAKEELDLDLHNVVNQRDWPQLIRLFKVKDIEKEIDLKKAKLEKDSLIDWLKSKDIEKEFIDGMEAFFAKVDLEATKEPRKFLELFFERVEPLGFSFKNYPALSPYLASYTLQKEINAPDLFLETEKLTDLILAKLAGREEERKLVSLLKDFLLLKRLFSLELSREEFNQVQQENGHFKPSQYAASLTALQDEKAALHFSDLASVDEVFNLALSFYEGTLKRDDAMTSNALRIMQETSESKAVLITGGFHSEGLTAHFKNKGIAFLEVTPKISEVGDTSRYLNVLMASTKLPSPSESEIKAHLFLSPIVSDGFPSDLRREALRTAAHSELRTAAALVGVMRNVVESGAANADELFAQLRKNARESGIRIRRSESNTTLMLRMIEVNFPNESAEVITVIRSGLPNLGKAEIAPLPREFRVRPREKTEPLRIPVADKTTPPQPIAITRAERRTEILGKIKEIGSRVKALQNYAEPGSDLAARLNQINSSADKLDAFVAGKDFKSKEDFEKARKDVWDMQNSVLY
ncbi:MAG: hypothetical protein HY447_04755, partial [Candidatus Omnitrophica bacterium]|nr:hypothetical protein [Candidatus Omnitrophota bacterium]